MWIFSTLWYKIFLFYSSFPLLKASVKRENMIKYIKKDNVYVAF